MKISSIANSVFCTLTLLWSVQNIHAHGMRLAYFEFDQTSSTDVTGRMRLTIEDGEIRPEFSKSCTVLGLNRIAANEITNFSVHCDRGIRGENFSVQGLGSLITEAIVRVKSLDGTIRSRVLNKQNANFVFQFSTSAATAFFDVFLQYFKLGVEHIVSGIDHILFLLGLVLLQRNGRRLLLTITSFTLAHSVTLALSALEILQVSQNATEACIALSLVMLACEILKNRPFRHEWMLAFCFGLIHGLGFAGALNEVGLPQAAIPLSLLSFNLGVEFGQIAFVITLLCCLRLMPVLQMRRYVSISATYIIGICGFYWLIERMQVFW